MTIDPAALSEEMRLFLTERHLATLTLRRADGRPHVTPVGFTYDEGECLARVITWEDSWKTRHVRREPHMPVAISSVDGGRWATLYGTATVSTKPESVAAAVERYASRYRQPKDRNDRTVIEIAVTEILGRG